MSIDPLAGKYPWNSPYAFSENRVLDGVELEGLEYKRIDQVPGEIWGAFKWAGGRIKNLAVESAKGIYGLVTTNPVETGKTIAAGLAEKGRNISTIAGTWWEILSSKFSRREAKIEEEDFYRAIKQEANDLVDGALGGVAGGGLYSLNKAVTITARSPLRLRLKNGFQVLFTPDLNQLNSLLGSFSNGGKKIPKPPRGKGSVHPSQRDPKRTVTKFEKEELLEKAGGKCETCLNDLGFDDARYHHLERHADGGGTYRRATNERPALNEDNHAIVCDDCHKKIHSSK